MLRKAGAAWRKLATSALDEGSVGARVAVACVRQRRARIAMRPERAPHAPGHQAGLRLALHGGGDGERRAACGARAASRGAQRRARSAPHTPPACRNRAPAATASRRSRQWRVQPRKPRSRNASRLHCGACRSSQALPGKAVWPTPSCATRTCGFQRLGAGARRHGASAAQRARRARQRRRACGSTGEPKARVSAPACKHTAARSAPSRVPRTGGGSGRQAGGHHGGGHIACECAARRFAG
jgi:hypothetical protein